MGAFVNPVPLSKQDPLRALEAESAAPARAHPLLPGALSLEKLLSPAQLETLLGELDGHSWKPVGWDGRVGEREPAPGEVGSYRLSIYNQRLADAWWARLRPLLGGPHREQRAQTDWEPYPRWQPVGLNPLFRFIRYLEGGLLVPHYDAPYQNPEGERSLLSTRLLPGGRGGGGRDPLHHRPAGRAAYPAA